MITQDSRIRERQIARFRFEVIPLWQVEAQTVPGDSGREPGGICPGAVPDFVRKTRYSRWTSFIGRLLLAGFQAVEAQTRGHRQFLRLPAIPSIWTRIQQPHSRTFHSAVIKAPVNGRGGGLIQYGTLLTLRLPGAAPASLPGSAHRPGY